MKKKVLTIALAMMGMLGFSAMAQDAPGDNNKMYQPREFTEIAFEGVLLDIDQQTKIDAINKEFKEQMQCKALDRKECAKNDCEKKGCEKQDCKKADCKKADCKKADCKKDNCKKDNCKKEDCKMVQDCKMQCPEAAKQCPKGAGFRGPKGPKPGAPCSLKQDYVKKVKEVLTPEQYTIFLENIVMMPDQPRGMQPMLRHGDKHGKMDVRARKDMPVEGQGTGNPNVKPRRK